MRHFYNAWIGFSTEKGFSWMDGYKIEEGMDRRTKRFVEKENQRLRNAGKREYNECVRVRPFVFDLHLEHNELTFYLQNLVLFIRRRDPRYQMSLSSLDPDAHRAAESARLKAELLLAAQERAKEREREAASYEAQEWQRGGADVVGEWGERSGGDEGEGEEEEQWCVACGKGFRSGGAWENHERSRKHGKNVERCAFSLAPFRRDEELMMAQAYQGDAA